MLHVISARCVARDLHTIALGLLERTCWRRFAAQWGDCKNSRIAPFIAIIINIIIITIIIIVVVVVVVTALVLFVGCLTSQQHASVSQGRICSDNFTCYHTEIEVADLIFHLTQSHYTDSGPTSPSTDPITPGAWQGPGERTQIPMYLWDVFVYQVSLNTKQ